jgi:hypothetical protein
LGFKVFSLEQSSFRGWDGVSSSDLDSYVRQMALFASAVEPTSDIDKILYEVIHREGFGLNSEVSRLPAYGQTEVYRVTDYEMGNTCHVTLSSQIHSQIAMLLGLDINSLFICRDDALSDDLAANLTLQCRLKTI